MIIALLVLAGVGFIASVLVNASTYLGMGLGVSMPIVWLLHYGLIVVFGLIFLYNKKHNTIESNHWKKAIECAPRSLSMPVFVVLVYTIFQVSFGIYGVARDGRISEVQGQKVLSKRGQVVRTLTDEEYALRKEKKLRVVSSVWMTAYLIPLNVTIGCLIFNKKEEESLDS